MFFLKLKDNAMEMKDLIVPSGVICVHCGANRCVPCTVHFGKKIIKGSWFCPDCGRTFSAG